MSRCRSCGASIVWARTTNGKLMPVDAVAHDEGNVLLTWGDEEGVPTRFASVLTGTALETQRGASPEFMHRSHFATCVDANKHRRRK